MGVRSSISRPFDGGVSYLYAALAGFPNVAWSIHPTTAHGTLSAWLVYTVMPYAAANGCGLGYSFIAEAYENFGWIGVPLVLLVTGWIAGRLSEAVRGRSDPASLALAVVAIDQHCRGCGLVVDRLAVELQFVIRDGCGFGGDGSRLLFGSRSDRRFRGRRSLGKQR